MFSGHLKIHTHLHLQSKLIRVHFANEDSISILKTPTKNQPKKIQVHKIDAMKDSKKRFPKLLSFYDLLENNSEVFLIVLVCNSHE